VRRLLVDRWSQGNSFLHRRDARAKLFILLVLLVFLGTVSSLDQTVLAGYGALLACGLFATRLPVIPLLRQAAWVLPFTVTFALISLVSGDSGRAGGILVKSFYSSLAVVIVMSTTPLPALLRATRQLGAPPLLVDVAQFLYRYLFVLAGQAGRIRQAASCRGGFRWDSAGGAVAVLFGSAYGKAEGIHRAMLSRGYEGEMKTLAPAKFGPVDAAFAAALVATLVVARLRWSW
jgi:cobalt/nickel transport system permease protein